MGFYIRTIIYNMLHTNIHKKVKKNNHVHIENKHTHTSIKQTNLFRYQPHIQPFTNIYDVLQIHIQKNINNLHTHDQTNKHMVLSEIQRRQTLDTIDPKTQWKDNRHTNTCKHTHTNKHRQIDTH